MEILLNFAVNNPVEYKAIQQEIIKTSPLSINQTQSITSKYANYPIKEILHQVNLQTKVMQKCPFAYKWLWTEKAAQQASAFALAQYHGSLFAHYATVADICCGIGSDLLFISKNKETCYAIDSDNEVLNLAQYNMNYFNRKKIIYQNVNACNFQEPCEAIYIDPDRRKGSKRVYDIQDISPPFLQIQDLIKKYGNVAVKLSPVIDYEKNNLKDYSYDFVSVGGELKECLLKSGELKTLKRAVLLPHLAIFKDKGYEPTDISSVKQYIFEPDVAIIRAHLVNDLAGELGISRIDEHIALLTSDNPIDTIFCKMYKVVDAFEYKLERLNTYLLSRGIGVVDIKTKGFSQTVEGFRSKLKLKDNGHAVVFIIRVGGKHMCVVCEK